MSAPSITLLGRGLGIAGLLLAIAGSVMDTAEFGPHRLATTILLAGLVMSAVAIVLNRKTVARVLGGGGVRAGTGTAVYAAIVFGVVVLANFIAARHHWRRDLSANQAYSLSEASRKVINHLDAPVRILGFFQEGDRNSEPRQKNEARLLLREYSLASNKIRLEIVDPLKEPGLAKSRISIRQDPAIVVEKGDRFIQATAPDEDSITSALLALSQEGTKAVYFLGGHGEHLPSARGGYAQAGEGLEKLHYGVHELMLSSAGEVPADCEVLVIAGAENVLDPAEEASITRYLQRGGRLLVLAEPLASERFDTLLAPWGLRVVPAVIADPRATIGGSVYTPVVSRYEDHPIVRSAGSNQTVFTTVAAVEWFETPDQLIFHEYLARTGPDAWAESNLEGVRQGAAPEYGAESDRMDQTNGIPVAAVAFRQSWNDPTRKQREGREKEETRIVLVGDSDFASDAYYGGQWNSNFFLNCVNWLAEEEVLIASRHSDERQRTEIPQRRLFKRLSLVLAAPPLLMGALGLLIWWKRRRL